jgi:hypothetical protein
VRSIVVLIAVLAPPQLDDPHRGCRLGERALVLHSTSRAPADWPIYGDGYPLLQMPNVFVPILILATVRLGTAILAEATISFLGYAVPPPYPAWGAMLSGTGRAYMLQSPWLSIWPGLAISLAVFGFNVLGDALRDVLDPRLRGSS